MANRALAGLLGLCALALPGPALPQAVAGKTFLVKNNSLVRLQCATKKGEAAWSPYFAIAPGGEWFAPAQEGETLNFFCAAPAERQVYTIGAGERYSLLKKPDSDVIILNKIVVPQG